MTTGSSSSSISCSTAARQVLVDDVVAVLEGLDLLAPDVRRVALVPQVVLDEPEHRVRDDVVEAVVGRGIGLHEAHVELAAVRRGDRERLVAVLALHARVVVAHRRRDPDGVAVRGQAGQRRHEAAGPALDRTVFLERDRPPVGDQDERPVTIWHLQHLLEDLQVVA